MANVVSQNPFELLGNDDGDDGYHDGRDSKPKVEQKANDGKGSLPPHRETTGNEYALLDRRAGRHSNLGRPTMQGNHRGRVGDGNRGLGRPPNDRRSRGPPGSEKKQKSSRETWSDENNKPTAEVTSGVTEADKPADENEPADEVKPADENKPTDENADENAAPVEEEVKQVSYGEYLTQMAAKKESLDSSSVPLELRQVDPDDQKWGGYHALEKGDDGDYVPASHQNTRRDRQRKPRNTLVVDLTQQTTAPTYERRGRGGFPRDSDRGGDRGERSNYARDSERGARGGRGRGAHMGRGDARNWGNSRGENRGSVPSDDSLPYNVEDQSAFPTLGQ